MRALSPIVVLILALAASAQAQPPQEGQPQEGQPQEGTVQQGTQPQQGAQPQQGTVQQGAVPWSGTAATPPPPAFLDVTDRRIEDTRPPPTPEQVQALREMTAEVDRFATVGASYRDTVLSIVRREYLRQRRARDQSYARQIREEERLQNEARDRAIRLFERFIRRYPDDPTYTPDAMFRLGELYFERSAIEFQNAYEEAQAARDRGETPEETGDTPDFAPTVELYQRLVTHFPDYRRLDGVYYLIGYCLNEMGKADEARAAWLNLVCANRYTYDPTQYAEDELALADEEAAEDEAAEAEEEESPALTLDGPMVMPEDQTGPYADPYLDCQPVQPDAEFISETWFRIGEFHFDDYGAEHALEMAISAYEKILADPEDRNYNLALYKVAWAYYRASRYPEAIAHFSQLVQWSDDEHRRTGRAGSELRPEAVQYLGISFAYDDWNENQIPDTDEGEPSGIDRVQDPTLLPQDRDWTAEVYFELGNVYFEENKLPDAIAIWRIALERWPNHARAPEITNMIARAFTRNQEMEEAITYRAALGDFGPSACREDPDCWWNQNVDNPSEQRQAEQLAENALINTAVHYHQEAQRLRRQCVEQQAPELCAQSSTAYELAARAYRRYLEQYPNNPQAYELRYNLADALYWSEDYEQAAIEYAAVRDSNLDDTHLSESARRVVESMKRIVDAAGESGALTTRTDPPEVQGTPPSVMPVAMPELLQRIAQAREFYLARVPERDDSEGVRAAYDYNNALLLYLYGYWPQAKERFERIFEERCDGPDADETGQVAWLSLRNIAVQLQQDAEIERLATEYNTRQCPFAPGEAAAVDCSDEANEEHPRCRAMGDLNALRYRRALDIYRRAEAASGDEQRQLYEESATVLVQAVNDNPNDPQAPIALEYAATALERTSRFESAARLYQRIIDEVGPQTSSDAERQQQLDAIMANAYFRLAYNANRFFDFDRAVDNYRQLADSPRFARSTDPTVVEKRQDGLINAAIILERQQQYPRATEYYRRAAGIMTDEEAQQNAYYRIAEMQFKQRNWNGTIREMRSFITRYQGRRGAGELVVQAYWRIAQATQSARSPATRYRSALQDVVNAFSRSGQEPGSIAAEYAAHAKFILVDGGIGEFEGFAIRPGRPATMQAYVNTLKQQIEAGATRATSIKEGYEPVLGYRRPAWTIGAFVRQGRAYEILARAVLNTQFVTPNDLARQMRRLPPDARQDIEMEIEGTVQGLLDEKVRPIECLAVARYALAARAARAGNIDNEYTRIATDRLQAYGDERIAECIAEAQRNDRTFQAYTNGEFARAPRGRNLEMEADTSPPSLSSPQSR